MEEDICPLCLCKATRYFFDYESLATDFEGNPIIVKNVLAHACTNPLCCHDWITGAEDDRINMFIVAARIRKSLDIALAEIAEIENKDLGKSDAVTLVTKAGDTMSYEGCGLYAKCVDYIDYVVEPVTEGDSDKV